MRDHNVRYSGMWVKSHWLASLERWCLSPCSYGGRVPGIAADPFAGRHRHSTPVLPRTGVLCGSVDLMLCAVQAGAGSAFGLAACGTWPGLSFRGGQHQEFPGRQVAGMR